MLLVDWTFYSRCLQSLDYTIGFGHNWIMQGSFKMLEIQSDFENYIFFEKNQAIKFSKKMGEKFSAMMGTSNF